MVSHMSASPSCSIGHFTFLPSIARAFFSDPALTPQHAESLLCCRLRQGRAGFGLSSSLPKLGRVLRDCFSRRSIEMWSDERGKISQRPVWKHQKRPMHMPREDRHPGPQSERQPAPNRLPFYSLRPSSFNFPHGQDFTSGGGPSTPAGEIGPRG